MQIDQRGDDADGQIPARVLRLLRRRGHRVEPDVGEEDDRRSGHHAGKPVWHEGMPVLRLDVSGADENEEGDRRELDRDHRGVEAGAFPNTDDQEHHDPQHDEDRRNVDECAGARIGRRAHPHGQVQAEAGEYPLEVAAPSDGNCHRPDGILEDQIPADHPGEDLTERRVRIRIRAARDRDHRRELRVTERRETTRHAGNDVREHDPRPRLVRRRGSRQHEDARADDCPDSQQRQVHRRQRTPQ